MYIAVQLFSYSVRAISVFTTTTILLCAGLKMVNSQRHNQENLKTKNNTHHYQNITLQKKSPSKGREGGGA